MLTFTMPDPAAINPLGARCERVDKLNAIIRREAKRSGVLVMDFDTYPVAHDPRQWYEDRLHRQHGRPHKGGGAGLAAGHHRVRRELGRHAGGGGGDRYGVPGADHR